MSDRYDLDEEFSFRPVDNTQLNSSSMTNETRKDFLMESKIQESDDYMQDSDKQMVLMNKSLSQQHPFSSGLIDHIDLSEKGSLE